MTSAAGSRARQAVLSMSSPSAGCLALTLLTSSQLFWENLISRLEQLGSWEAKAAGPKRAEAAAGRRLAERACFLQVEHRTWSEEELPVSVAAIQKNRSVSGKLSVGHVKERPGFPGSLL